ncbi:hypothetical protein [Saccharopolyspora mangrovi]|uniref:DUF4913 domain-containing protein n=1 Tax=Saccharopolyspora mangrovi TaxID=3082379 RepID=A0ABU6AJ20_9PSEU|nr:hypothetical protein [Saccharopolyspora sp. S2-29]MEB3371310.1 hypothetical protein [Saccharopolyspora sp. S2-29]
MSEDDIAPNRRRRAPATDGHSEHDPADTEELDKQLGALTEVVGGLAKKVNSLRERIDAPENGDTGDDGDEQDDTHDRPASWVVFTPPAAAEDRQHRKDGHSPNWTLDNFVAWYNATYVGLAGGPATPIPECWRQHPGLAMEVATLAYSWRRANVGATANVRDAQYWHHTWRPGFAARLTEWTHAHCLDGRHRPAGANARPDRFTQATSGHTSTEEVHVRKEVPS